MKKIVSILIVAVVLLSSLSAYALDLEKAYTEFKTTHPAFVNSLINNGISEDTIISFTTDVYDYLMEIDSYTPVTEANFEKSAMQAITDVSSREKYYTLQYTLLILYPDSIKLAVTEGKVSEEFKPFVDTIKKILFEKENGSTDSGTTSPGSPGTPSTPSTPSIPSNPSPLPEIKPSSFSDIDASHWAYTSVSYLADNFILNGYLDKTFKPENYITRAEFAKIIISATDTYNDAAISSFSDVSVDDWYYPYISTAYNLGYIKGYPDGSFRPDDNVTRADICAIVNRVLKAASDGSVSSFTDDFAIPSYARESVYALAAKGIINGYTDGTFLPTAYATRAQTAKIIYSALFQK